MPPPELVVCVGRLELAIGPAVDGAADRYECRLRGGVARCRATAPADVAALSSWLGLNGGPAGAAAEYVVWEVRVEPFDPPVTTVRLRLGTDDAWGPSLCEFPLNSADGQPEVRSRMFVNPDHQGIPFGELWDLMQRRPVLVEVELEDSVEPLAIGSLLWPTEREWQPALC